MVPKRFGARFASDHPVRATAQSIAAGSKVAPNTARKAKNELRETKVSNGMPNSGVRRVQARPVAADLLRGAALVDPFFSGNRLGPNGGGRGPGDPRRVHLTERSAARLAGAAR